MRLSRRVLSVSPSVTLAIAAKAKEMAAKGLDVVSLSAGEPDFDTPEIVKAAAIDALQKGQTKYTPAVGTLELRTAIAEKFKRDQGLVFKPSQIVVSCGAKHSIFNILFALLDEGDEVLIPTPYWLSYPEMVTVLGGRSVFLETTEKTDFKIRPDALRKKLSRKTKIFILNSPSNPTGATYTRKELEDIAVVLKDFPECVILSDEIYEKLIFDGAKHVSIAQINAEMAARTIIVNGHSKAYSMTGWRLGYAAFQDAKIAEAVGSVQSHSTSNPTSFAQAGGVTALQKAGQESEKMRVVFEKRRDWFCEAVSKIKGLKPFKAQGAFYLFVGIKDTGIDSVTFSERLLEEAHVAVVPGKPFGAEGYIRMSFATSDEKLKEAVKRISNWISKL